TSCAPLFEAAFAVGVITEEDVWQRARLALEAGNVALATRMSPRLSPEHALPVAALTPANADPARYLAKLNFKHANAGQRLVVQFALQRLARRQLQLAYDRWQKIAENFTPEEQRYAWGWLGYAAARNQDARALGWFKKAGDAPLNAQQLAWRARAALRALDWREVQATIEKMPPQQQQESAWRYWRARALKAQGQSDAANTLFWGQSSEHDFYGLLAAEEVGSAMPRMLPTTWRPGADDLNAMQSRPSIQRVLELYRMDLRPEAYKEWVWTVRNFDDKQLLTAAEIARRNELYDRAINTSELTRQLHDFNMRYLAPYREVLRDHIQNNKLDEAWVYGLMRQESRFVAQAKSSVGAAGVMQIMPATAKWIARKMGLKDYRHALLHDVDTNLMLGTYYMKTVLDWFDGNPAMASAAYNAGPARARQWRGDTPLEGAIYVETIPFDETREYVKKVMSNTMYYAERFGQTRRSLKDRLGVIAARSAENQKPIPDEQ
ncbi:MAG: lytic transglycosylase domain-containing protein, partial [Gallionellaceae bacterium]|nr:lytic transglycosylase domain-containing protein [Gallionellaceae bacterium]